MSAATARLKGILAGMSQCHPDETEIQLLKRIDAQMTQLIQITIEVLPTDRYTVIGFVELARAVDARLDELGWGHFASDARVQKALTWMADETTPVDKVLVAAKGKWPALRAELWAQVS